MRIAKYVHSCLLVETDGGRLLFDPGQFTFAEGRLSPDAFADVSVVVLTHSHPDHIAPDAIARIVEASGAAVIGNGDTRDALKDAGVEVEVVTEGEHRAGAFTLQAIPTPHQPILGSEPPEHTAFLVDGRFLNPGDSFDERLHAFAGVEALALPIMAPFMTELDGFAFATAMRPGHVLPVHDGYARPFFVEARHATYGKALEKEGIAFHRLAAPGAAVEI